MNPVRTDGNRFIDRDGRHILLHGVNMVCKDKSKHYIDDWTATDFAKLKEWGCNTIRLGIIWDGIEPQPGQYNKHYLEQIRQLIRLANRYDQYVFLDMHQDLYSQQYADGAPAWATITDGHQYEATALWSDAYLFDPAVQTAFDHFWNNTAAPDGIGLQDHYATAWKYVANQLASEPNIIGYDLMNEPFIGSGVRQITTSLFTQFAQLMSEATNKPTDIEQLMSIWLNPKQKLATLKMLDDPTIYASVMSAANDVQASFERNVLSPFYNKVAAAIREVDKEGILLLETNYFSNMGVESSIQPVVDITGTRDVNQCYAPHGYDLVTDSDYVHAANDARVTFIFNQHLRTSERLQMPMLVGEWGAYGNSKLAEAAALHIQSVFENLLISDTYWCYLSPDMNQYASFKAIHRGYPMAVSGTILAYRFEHNSNRFQLTWEEATHITAPTVIYLPHLPAAQQASIVVDHSSNSDNLQWIPSDQGTGGLLIIPSIGGGQRQLRIG